MAQQEVPKKQEVPKNLRELHKSIITGEKEKVIPICEESTDILLHRLQPCNESALHVAIQMRNQGLAQKILETYIARGASLKERNGRGDISASLEERNDLGDTILHEAATTNMKSLVEILLNSASAKQLLNERNKQGESPLFKAVHYGQTEMFRLLADQQYGDRKEVLDLLKRNDQTTALHIAILAEFFDLALEIATQFPELREKEDGKKMTALQTLSSIPSAFKSCSDYGVLEKCIYYCIPSETPRDSLQGGRLPPNYDVCVQCFSGLMHMIIKGLRITSIPIIARLQAEKRKHESAVKLARSLIDDSLSRYIRNVDNPGQNSENADVKNKGSTYSKTEAGSSEIKKEGTNKESDLKEKIQPILKALFLATSNRIVEVVEEILTVLPEAVEHINDAGQNILHLAIKHRQLKIFDYVRKMELPTMLLDRQIDEDGYTILHQFGHPEASSGGSTHHGPVFQLRKEVQWFERVKELVPAHYKMHRIKFPTKIPTKIPIKIYKEPTAQELGELSQRIKELTAMYPKDHEAERLDELEKFIQRNQQKLSKELTAEELKQLLERKHQKPDKEQTAGRLDELETFIKTNDQKLYKELTADELAQLEQLLKRRDQKPYKELTAEGLEELEEFIQTDHQKLYKELTADELAQLEQLLKRRDQKPYKEQTAEGLDELDGLERFIQTHYQKLYKELTAEELEKLFQTNHQKIYKELTAEEFLQGNSQKLYKELTAEELGNYQKRCKELTAKQLEELFQRNRQKLYKELTAEEVKELLQGNNQKLYEELTAEELFQRKHQMLLEEAQKWLLQTSNSCSIVALLIATVAFVAAYNVSGGSDQATGLPILLHNQPFFVIFSMMNMLSFISSLTSLIMFLSITISPFQLQDFRHSLPKKLQLGFAFLFFSVAVTVLAFAATIALNVQLTEQLTTVLKYISAFLPVTFLAFLLSPLLVASLKAVKFTLKGIGKILINFFLPDSSDKTNTYPIYKAQ